jgi:hypothetical protein
MSEKVALVWTLLITLGLLLGLVVLAAAFGVVRHLRRQRQAARQRERSRRRTAGDDDEDVELSGGSHDRADPDEDPEDAPRF